MGSACGKHGQKRMVSKVLEERFGRKNFVRPKNRQENIIKMFLRSCIKKSAVDSTGSGGVSVTSVVPT
jgi:hypothetical protein